MNYGLFIDMLSSNFHINENIPNIFLIFIFNLILLWLENKLYDFISFKFNEIDFIY